MCQRRLLSWTPDRRFNSGEDRLSCASLSIVSYYEQPEQISGNPELNPYGDSVRSAGAFPVIASVDSTRHRR